VSCLFSRKITDDAAVRQKTDNSYLFISEKVVAKSKKEGYNIK
jgi:hypothetical protein